MNCCNMEKSIKSIVFVCLGNICRSPMCESIMSYLLKQNGIDDLHVYSLGTSDEEYGNPIHRGTKNKLYSEGIPIIPHKASQIERNDYDRYDLIVGLDHSNIRSLYRIFGSDKDDKIRLLLSFAGEDRDVRDPWWTGNFDETYDDCMKGCKALLEHIKTCR